MLRLVLALACLGLGPPDEPRVEVDDEAAEDEQTPEPSSATHGQLVVQVKVHGRRDPIVGARVIDIEDPKLEPIETDADGHATVWLSPGVHHMQIRADGYQPLGFEVTIATGSAEQLELRLDEVLGGNRYRTVVGSERAIALGRVQLRDEEIHELPGSGGDPFAVVKSLPGAAQVAGFLPYVVVRGAAPGNTGYYLDGVRVPALFHVAAGPSVVHPYFIDSVDFYPSGAPVRLGRYASGIIEGRTRMAGRDRVRGEVDVRLTDTGTLLEIPFDRRRGPECAPKRRCGEARGALTVGGRYSYTGLILSAIPNLNVKLRFWDYQARLDHDLGKRARYTAFVFGSYDELGPRQTTQTVVDQNGLATQTVNDKPNPYLRLEFHRIDQRIRQRLRKGGMIDYRVALGLDRSGVQSVRVDEWRVAPRIDATLNLSEQLQLHAGLDQEFQVFRLPRGLRPDGVASIEDLGLLLSERFVSVTGVYADIAYRKAALEVRPGVRVDAWVQSGHSPYLLGARTLVAAVGVDPRLLLREAVGEHVHLRQSVGLYHQAPDPPIPIPGVESVGLEQGLQRNLQGSFGWQWSIADRFELTQDAFVGRLSNMQDYELSQGLNSGDGSADELTDYLIRVSGWAWGLESMLRLIPDGHVYGWLAYTLSWSYRDYPLGGFAPATWDQRHLLNAVVGWAFNRKWRLGGRVHVNSGRPYTTRRVLSDGSLEDLGVALTNHRNDARLPAFMQLDVRVERIFTTRNARLHLYLDLVNADFGREVLRCDSLASTSDSSVQVVHGCVNPQALRYILPALGLRALF